MISSYGMIIQELFLIEYHNFIIYENMIIC